MSHEDDADTKLEPVFCFLSRFLSLNVFYPFFCFNLKYPICILCIDDIIYYIYCITPPHVNEQLSIECLSHVHVFACLRLCLGPFRRLMYNIDVYVFGFFSVVLDTGLVKKAEIEKERVWFYSYFFYFVSFPFLNILKIKNSNKT